MRPRKRPFVAHEVLPPRHDEPREAPQELERREEVVVARDGFPIEPTGWEDTVNVAGRRRLTLAFRADDRPGRWIYHCHILEHHAAGMMGHFDVVR